MNSVTRYWYKKLANFAKAAQTVDTVGFFHNSAVLRNSPKMENILATFVGKFVVKIAQSGRTVHESAWAPFSLQITRRVKFKQIDRELVLNCLIFSCRSQV